MTVYVCVCVPTRVYPLSSLECYSMLFLQPPSLHPDLQLQIALGAIGENPGALSADAAVLGSQGEPKGPRHVALQVEPLCQVQRSILEIFPLQGEVFGKDSTFGDTPTHFKVVSWHGK